jgi:signal transduction histidine kinase
MPPRPGCRIVLIMKVRASAGRLGYRLDGTDEVPGAGRAPRDRAVDTWLFLLCAGFTALAFVSDIGQQFQPVPTALDAALGGLASFGVWVRRRWPVAFAVVAGLAGAYSVNASFVALIALFTVAAYRNLGAAVLIAAGNVLTSLFRPLVRTDLPALNWWQGALGVACVMAALAWGMFVRTRRQLAVARRERILSEREFLVTQARQLERDRIAREMHDVLAHRLSLLSLHAGALELWPDAPPEIARAAGVIRGSAHGALEDLRHVIGVLRAGRRADERGADERGADERGSGERGAGERGAELAGGVPERPQPTLVDLPVLIDESRKAGTRVVLECEVTDLGAVPEAVGRTAFRIVQEGLTNARKHADDAAVSVAVRGAAADGLTVEIRNPWPVGVARTVPIPGAGMGIIGLAERAALIGGRLEHGRTPAGEFRLWAWLPWRT